MAAFASMILHLLSLYLALAAGSASPSLDADGEARAKSMLQTWTKQLDAGASKDTPVTRVVKLLENMQKTLQAEMDEDQTLYEKLKCWCESNTWEKGNAVEASEAKIQALKSDIDSLTAKEGELRVTIKDLKDKTASDKAALAEATEIREKQLKEFHGMETDSIQAIESLKAALVVLGKHHGEGALPQLSFSMLQRGRNGPWSASHDEFEMSRPLDEFMRRNGFDTKVATTPNDASRAALLSEASPHKFSEQHEDSSVDPSKGEDHYVGWSAQDTAILRQAMKSASAFVQSHHGGAYYPSYTAQSGEIVGILKQMKEEMEGELGEAQKQEMERATNFEQLRSAKTAEIEAGEKMEEQKEDELATTVNNLAEAKEDLGQEETVLEENQKFLKNMGATCAEADKDFEERKKSRLAEIQAVADTIGILTQDEARDAMSGTYSFLQRSSNDDRRKAAASALRKAATEAHSPQLSILATQVEINAFTKVKKAIDDMIAMLKTQQEDEVKKVDWCKAEFHENEMTNAKTEDRKADLDAKISELGSTMQTLDEGIADAHKQIAQLEVDLQRAGQDRKAQNLDFQKTVADQMVTVEVLKQALDKLAKYYDQESLLQSKNKGEGKQEPDGSVAPVAQMEYNPNKGATGVMQMIEKLIQEANELMAESKKSESEAQSAYEQTIADTNDAISALHKEVVTKSKAISKAKKDKLQAESDLTDTVSELEDLAKVAITLHTECDYVLKNFDTRQDARTQEIEALQQAKQILSGASLS